MLCVGSEKPSSVFFKGLLSGSFTQHMIMIIHVMSVTAQAITLLIITEPLLVFFGSSEVLESNLITLVSPSESFSYSSTFGWGWGGGRVEGARVINRERVGGGGYLGERLFNLANHGSNLPRDLQSIKDLKVFKKRHLTVYLINRLHEVLRISLCILLFNTIFNEYTRLVLDFRIFFILSLIFLSL